MKEQIVRGLLSGRADGDGTQEGGAAAGLEVGAPSADESKDAGDTWKRRENLVKTGAVTPLDALDDFAVDLVGRRRKTLQDYKIAEGMSVKLPRSGRNKTRPRRSCSDLSGCRRESAGELGKVDNTQGSLGTTEEVNTENSAECPLCAQPVKVDDPANPDVSISRHMDRCSRSSRQQSRHRLAGTEEGSATGKGAFRRMLAVRTVPGFVRRNHPGFPADTFLTPKYIWNRRQCSMFRIEWQQQVVAAPMTADGLATRAMSDTQLVVVVAQHRRA